MKHFLTLFLLVAVSSLASLARDATLPSSPKEEEYALIIYRALFGIETTKEQLFFPLQPQLDKYIAYTTAETQVAEITQIVEDAATQISANRAFREQILYEYKAAFTESELAEYARWLESPLGRKLRRFELRNSQMHGPLVTRHFQSQLPRIRALLASAEESTRPGGARSAQP